MAQCDDRCASQARRDPRPRLRWQHRRAKIEADIRMADTSMNGHHYLISTAGVDSSFVTALTVRQTLADFIDEITHHNHFATVTLRARKGPEEWSFASTCSASTSRTASATARMSSTRRCIHIAGASRTTVQDNHGGRLEHSEPTNNDNSIGNLAGDDGCTTTNDTTLYFNSFLRQHHGLAKGCTRATVPST